ncbi:hypothetical protein [Yersinia kristensenii]|uniref:hypothetical protein n=1 Tax=Yersinia kristensenii TaxID=28152 RepID=UPI000B70E90A|nr:hypothetical protein [Yersinia kristensenii]MBW5812838.1 hypothetical protein [Yersinia kristensenii]MBW5830139.1 hypothetical protein [Yersinia kristensenii]OWF82928.1 hypothetical protein B4907_12425 [Yersinia kristensenii]
MKRNFVPLSFICVIALSTPFHAGADFSYHAELPKDSQVSTDYLEKRKALRGAAHDADSWQRQLDEEKARVDADVARHEKEKQMKCQQQEHQPRPRVDNPRSSYLTPDPCAASIKVKIPVN